MILLYAELKFLQNSHSIICFPSEIYFYLQQEFECKTGNCLIHDCHHRKHISSLDLLRTDFGWLFLLALSSNSSISYALHFLLFLLVLHNHEVVLSKTGDRLSATFLLPQTGQNLLNQTLSIPFIWFLYFSIPLSISTPDNFDISMHSISGVFNAFQCW